MTRTYNISITLFAVGAFSLGMDAYITAGLIPLIERDLAINISMVAQMVTAFTLSYGLGSPVLIALMPDRMPRIGLLLALLLFVVANAASAMADSFIWLILFRGLAGIGAGVTLAMSIAAATSIVPVEKQGKTIATIMAGMAGGTVLGVPLGLVLADHFGWRAALWLITILSAVAFFGLQAKLPHLPKRPNATLRERLSLLRNTQILSILLVSLLAAISSLGMYTFIASLIYAMIGQHAVSVTLYFWVWGIGGVVGSFAMRALIHKISSPRLSLWIMIILAVSLFLLPVTAVLNIWLIMLPIALWGASGWALQVPQNDQLLKLREAFGDGNLAVALNGSSLYLGSAIGASSGGLILDYQYPVWLLPIAAGVVASIGAFIQIYHSRKPKN